MNGLSWVEFGSVAMYTRRYPVVLPAVISAEWVRVQFSFERRPKDTWFRAGWISQVHTIAGKPHVRPSQVVPLAPSVFKFDPAPSYQIRFEPVEWLPGCTIRFFRSL